MNVLVSGGAGFIGSHVVDRLVDASHHVSVVDNLVTGRREQVHARATVHVVDIRDPALGAVIDSSRPDVVVHAAAQVSVSRSIADPLDDASVNVLGTIALLDHCRRAAVQRIVYISTGGAAYGDTDVIPTPETHPTRAVSPYGISKTAGERYVDLWSRLTKREAVVLRLANVYGPRQTAEGEAGVIAIFAHRARNGRPCVVNGDGHQTRDFIFVADVADAVVRAVEQPAVEGVFNIATGLETSVNQILIDLRRVLGIPVSVQYGEARPGEQRRSVLDPHQAARHLGWKATTSLADGLNLTVKEAG